MLGVDLVYIPRLRCPKESFLKGVLTPKERALYEQAPKKDEFLAGRCAAEEAYLKALGKGLGGARLSEIEILPESGGQPFLYHEGKRYEVSISHDGEYAIAIVFIP